MKKTLLILFIVVSIGLIVFSPTASAVTVFTSQQLAGSASNGYILSTNGTNNSWIPNTATGGFDFTPTSYGNATSTTIGFLSGLLSNGSTTVTGTLHTDSQIVTTGNTIQFAGYSALPQLYAGDSTTGLHFDAPGIVSIHNGGVQTFLLSSTNRVGIASSSPNALLSVHGSSINPLLNLFQIGSSTASATTTLFNISNTGAITTSLGTGLVKSTSGLLSIGTAGSDYENPLTFSAPLMRTTNNVAWTGLATTSQPASSNLLVSDGGAGVFGVATGTVSAGSSAITVTAGRSAIGGALAIDCATASGSQNGCLSSTDWTTFNNKPAFSFTPAIYGSQAVNATTTGLWLKTATPYNLIASTTFTTYASTTQLSVSGNSYFTGLSQGFAYIGSNSILNTVATSSLNLPNTALQNSSITINGSAISLGGSVTVASTTLLGDSNNFTGALNRFTNGSTSNATTSVTQYFGAAAVPFSSLLRTDSTGKLSAVTIGSNITFDGTTLSASGGGGAYPFTPSTQFGINTSATTTALQLTAGLTASSTSRIDSLQVGSSTVTSTFANNPLYVGGQTNSYVQAVIQNRTSGTNASGLLAIHADIGSDTTYYHEVGINNSGYSQAAFSSQNQLDAFNIASDGALVIGTASTTNTLADLRFITGGTASSSIRMVIRQSGLIGIGTTTPMLGALTIATTTAPQLVLSAGAGFSSWTTRNSFGTLYFATTSITAPNATSTTAAFSINSSSGAVTIRNLGTAIVSVVNGVLSQVTLGLGLLLSNNTLYTIVPQSFTYATSTAWTGTTTIPLEVGQGEQWNYIRCFTDVGTLNVDFYQGDFTNGNKHLLPFFNASTTIGTTTPTSNNVPNIGTTTSVRIGTPASSPTKITCTIWKQY